MYMSRTLQNERRYVDMFELIIMLILIGLVIMHPLETIGYLLAGAAALVVVGLISSILMS
jgi:hypothetical protein